MVEAIVSLMVLGVLIHVVAATDRLQDLALRASLAGRYAAIMLTRQAEPDSAFTTDVADRFFAGPRHRWQTRQGESMLEEGTSSIRVAVAERQGVARMQVGQNHSLAGPIRQEVLRRDRGITHATVDVMPRLGRRKPLSVSNDWGVEGAHARSIEESVDRAHAQSIARAHAWSIDRDIAQVADRGDDRHVAAHARVADLGVDRNANRGVDHSGHRVNDPLGLAAWESMTLRLRRHTAILTDAGHAHSDAGVTARLQASPQTWATAAARSAHRGRDVAVQLASIDRPWRRPAPQFDWLTPWEHLVPSDRVGKAEDASWR